MIQNKQHINNLIKEIIILIRKEQEEEYIEKLRKLQELEIIIQGVLQYGHLYHFQKKQLKKMGFEVGF